MTLPGGGDQVSRSEKHAFSMRFMDTCLNFIVASDVLHVVQAVSDFFRSHFDVEARLHDQPDVTLIVDSYSNFTRGDYAEANFVPLTIRKSSAAAFNLFGEKATPPGLEVVESRSTETALVLPTNNRTAHLYITEHSHVQVVEFIRDVVIKAEERRGTLILHAAGAVSNGQALAIVGNKGAGKSTLLLDLTGRRGLGFLSGDKLFLKVKEQEVLVYGWPDFPHLGYGTISRYPELVAFAESQGYLVDSSTPNKKVLLPAAGLQRAMAFSYVRGPVPLGYVVFPDVRGASVTSIQPLEDSDVGVVLEHLEYSANNSFAGWHNFLQSIKPEETKPVVRQLAQALSSCCRFLSHKGPGPLCDSHLKELQK